MRVVPGIHSVQEALKVRPRAIKNIWIKPDPVGPDLQELIHEAKKLKISLDRPHLQAMSKKVESHQGVIAFIEESPQWPRGDALKQIDEGLIFVLDGVVDPHNLGSLARTLWNLDGLGLVISKDRSAHSLSPAAQKVASGAFEHLPVLEVANLQSELKTLKDLGFWIYGLDLPENPEEKGSPIWDLELGRKAVLVIGSEGYGIKKPVLRECDAICHIPNLSHANSFNASVAGAIAGYEFRRQLAKHLK